MKKTHTSEILSAEQIADMKIADSPSDAGKRPFAFAPITESDQHRNIMRRLAVHDDTISSFALARHRQRTRDLICLGDPSSVSKTAFGKALQNIQQSKEQSQSQPFSEASTDAEETNYEQLTDKSKD